MGAAGIPNLYHLMGAEPGEYLVPGPHHHGMAIAVGTSTEAPAVYPTAVFSVLRGYGGFSPGFDAFRAPDHTSTQHIEPVGASHEEDESRIPGLELNFGTYEINPGRQEHQLHSGETSRMENVEQRVILTFPEGDDDAVIITASDLEGLQPAGYLSDNIIDFYMMFLKRQLSLEDRERFYFFNSFFFRKLVPDSRSNAEIHECGVDFNGVRSWTGEVNLFEKDYVFIPILRRSHWSLIIVCHLNSLSNSRDKRRGSPCVYHLDPLEGQHESFEDQIRRSRGGHLAKHVLGLILPGLCPRDAILNLVLAYVENLIRMKHLLELSYSLQQINHYMIQACMERYRDSNDMYRIILALAREMKYVRAEVPRQGNGHDCGVYLLEYVEVFLRKSNSAHFNFASTSNIWGPDFAHEASSKRSHIRSLISELSMNPQGQLSSPMHIQPRPHPRASDAPNPYAGRKCSPKPRKSEQCKVSKKWKKEETSLLLKRMVEVGRKRKGTEGATHWDLISEDIKAKLECIRTADECRRRYDTLLKAYKKVEKTGKSFWDTTKEERAELNLATPLTDEWCGAMDIICQRKSGTAKSGKRAKRGPDGEDGMPSGNPAPPPIPSVGPARAIPSQKQVAIPGFSTLREDLRRTLLNSIQFSYKYVLTWWSSKLQEVCRMLSIVEDRKEWEIRNDIYELSDLKLVDLRRGLRSNWKEEYLEKDKLRVFQKFAEKVLCKNPDFNFYLTLCKNDDIVSIPKAPASLSLQQIRVLVVKECSQVEEVDLSCFPELRFLSIQQCNKLRLVRGWKVATKLGCLEIQLCRSYVVFPPAQHLSSAGECRLGTIYPVEIQSTNSVPDDFRQCGGLRRLNIWGNASSAVNEMDLSTLRFLEVLTFRYCDALKSIQGLSALHSLTTLDLSLCEGLKRVPQLGCLKALTRLEMSGSGVEEIPGVQELYSLTLLDLARCDSLEELPFLGHLKALASLDISYTPVKKIPGVEDLVSLETLNCECSELEGLPDLHHLPQLQKVWIYSTPLREMESSPLYFGKGAVYFGSSNAGGKVLVAEISDISDPE